MGKEKDSPIEQIVNSNMPQSQKEMEVARIVEEKRTGKDFTRAELPRKTSGQT